MTVLHVLLKIIEWTLFGGVLVAFLILASPLLPTKKFLASYAVVSGSMEPNVPVGALALVQPTATAQLQPGDIIAFPDPTQPKRIILHRIVAAKTLGTLTQFETKGDHNPIKDNWLVTSASVKGKMLMMIPTMGYPIIWVQRPLGFATFIGIPAAILVLLQLKMIYEGIEEEVQKRTKFALQKSEVHVM